MLLHTITDGISVACLLPFVNKRKIPMNTERPQDPFVVVLDPTRTFAPILKTILYREGHEVEIIAFYQPGMTLFWLSGEMEMQVKGAWYRTYCPIHGSHQERSLAIKAATDFGHCFDCQARVFVADFDPQMATRLQRQRYGRIF